MAVELGEFVRDIPDFPREGILYRDITPMLGDAAAFRAAIDGLVGLARVSGGPIDYVIGAEARGFLLGPALAHALGAGFVLARKPGKLPYETVRAEYLLEYGTDSLELHSDAVAPGTRVLVHDDLLATGGTASAVCALVEQLGGEVVGCNFLIELEGLGGRAALGHRNVQALLPLAAGA